MRKIIEKLIAAALAVLFMALVQPDHMPALWQTALTTILMYWIVYGGIDDIISDVIEDRRKLSRKTRDRPIDDRPVPHREIIWTDEDMKRWAGNIFTEKQKTRRARTTAGGGNETSINRPIYGNHHITKKEGTQWECRSSFTGSPEPGKRTA